MKVRSWPGVPDPISVLGWELRPNDLVDQSSARALLRRSNDRGINLFAWNGTAAEERRLWVSGVLPDLDAHLILTRSSRDLADPVSDRSDAEAWRTGIASTLPSSHVGGRAAPNLWIEWDARPGETEILRTAVRALQRMVADGTIEGWGIRRSSWPRFPTSSELPMFASGTLSLLEPSAVPGTIPDGVPFVARDVLAGGRLAGAGALSGPTLQRAPGGPRPIHALSEEMGRVLRFGFLSIRGKRTLGQAAIRWVLDQPGVAAALAFLPTPEKFDELAGWEDTPSLTVEEIARSRGGSSLAAGSSGTSLD